VGPHRFGLRWTTRHLPDTGSTRTNQYRLTTAIQLVPRRLRLSSSVNLDGLENFLQSQRHILDWTGSCFGMRFEFSEFDTLSGFREPEREFRFSLSLKNVGTFIDLTGGEHQSL